MTDQNLESRTIDNPFVSDSERTEALKKFIQDSGAISEKKTFDIDLHLHTNYSDGFWTPSGLILEAYRKDMNTIAFTDHDGFKGIKEAFDAVNKIEKITGKRINFIPGIEVSTNYYFDKDKKKEIHILGYFPSDNYEDFANNLDLLEGRDKSYFNAFQDNRILRIFEMVKKFNTKLSLEIPLLNRVRQFQNPVISDKTVVRGLRKSIAPGRLLTSTGIFEVFDLYTKGRIEEITDEAFSSDYLEALKDFFGDIKSPQQFMNEYFHKKEPFAKIGYIGLTESPEWAVKTIRSMGGIPVLAHPAKYMEHYKDLLSKLVPLGLEGVEVFSDHFKDKQILQETIDFVSDKYPALLITVGSDCHGKSIDREIDYTPKNIMGLRENYGLSIDNYKEKIVERFFS